MTTVKPHLSKVLNDNLSSIQKLFHNNKELIFRPLFYPTNPSICLVYLETITDKKMIQEHILSPLLKMGQITGSHNEVIENTIEISKIKTVSLLDDVKNELSAGNTLIFIDGLDQAIAADTADWKDRSLAPPQTQRGLNGPQIGFTELASNNLSLIKRVIKNNQLTIEDQKIGTETNTGVYLLYLADKVDPDILHDVKRKMESIDLKSILDSSYIQESITSDQITPFPLVLTTERPDVTSGHIIEGKIAILCDGSPNVLIVPSLFMQFFQTADDYYESSIFDFARLIRIISFVISIFLIPLYISFTLFHQELVPSELLISLAAQRQIVPLPLVIEVIFLMLIFEVILESSIRLPTGITLAFSIIGTIILGQSAAEAGLVQLSTLVIISATYVLNFAVPIHPFGNAIKIIRYILVFLASTQGLLGLILGTIVLINHLSSLNSFGVPYLSPITPINTIDLKDTFIRFPLKKIINTPKKYNKDDLK
ncbi:spore germination protein [Sutcliffiella horikoshii]|uniref:spore germination protein n=1 Tax=Sutcliffiella horikoshii TaxID=79883 RepID=UPI001F35FAFD|nr:spore germination protein [Sutcliffiella horikoshii]MCG1022746.1 spore germination protein [Sutcliffiella horikoshii]